MSLTDKGDLHVDAEAQCTPFATVGTGLVGPSYRSGSADLGTIRKKTRRLGSSRLLCQHVDRGCETTSGWAGTESLGKNSSPSQYGLLLLVAGLLFGCPHDRAKRSFADGLEAHRAGRADDARARYGDALAADSDLAGVRINLAILSLTDGKWEDAEPLLVEEHRLHDDDIEANAALALFWSAGPKANEAQRLAKLVVDRAEIAPAKAVHQAQLALAISAQTTGDPYALDLARVAYKSDPKPAQTFVLGTLLADAGNCPEGADHLQRLIDDAVYGPSARTNLAVLRTRCGDLPGGLATALPLKELAPKSAYAQGVLGALLLRSNRVDEALIALENTVTLAPERPGVRNTLAVAQYKAGRVDSAKSTLDAEIRLFPTNSELPYRNLAWIYVQETDFRRAIDVLTSGVSVFPESKMMPQSLALLRQFVQQ